MNGQLWTVQINGRTQFAPVEVRDIIVKCFIEAQNETIRRAATKLGTDNSSDHVANSILALVKMTFKRVGADFDNPEQSDLTEVVDVLSRKARAMGTPADIVEHHLKQIKEVIDLCSC